MVHIKLHRHHSCRMSKLGESELRINANLCTKSHLVRHHRALSDDSICAAHTCTFTVSLDSLIRPATSRDAFFEKVRNENPFPIAENPLRLVSAISCSTRNTVISDFIRALDAPSEKGR